MSRAIYTTRKLLVTASCAATCAANSTSVLTSRTATCANVFASCRTSTLTATRTIGVTAVTSHWIFTRSIHDCWSIGKYDCAQDRERTLCCLLEEFPSRLEFFVLYILLHNVRSLKDAYELPNSALILCFGSGNKKDVGVCSSAPIPVVRLSHCPCARISNASQPTPSDYIFRHRR